MGNFVWHQVLQITTPFPLKTHGKLAVIICTLPFAHQKGITRFYVREATWWKRKTQTQSVLPFEDRPRLSINWFNLSHAASHQVYRNPMEVIEDNGLHRSLSRGRGAAVPWPHGWFLRLGVCDGGSNVGQPPGPEPAAFDFPKCLPLKSKEPKRRSVQLSSIKDYVQIYILICIKFPYNFMK